MKPNFVGWTALAVSMFGMGFGASATVADPQDCLDSRHYWFQPCRLEGRPLTTCFQEQRRCIRTCSRVCGQGG